MTNQGKNPNFSLVSLNKLAYPFVSIIFFFAWSDLVTDEGSFLPLWLLISGGLFVPLLLLIGVIQYKSQIAYSITLVIFVIAILLNLSSLPYYIEQYAIEQNNGIPDCSCCPVCEIKSILILVIGCGIAIGIMNKLQQ